MTAPSLPATKAPPARRLTDRALLLWRAIRALPPREAQAQLALLLGDAVRPVGSAPACSIARRVDSLAPVAWALGQPVEVEGWETGDPDQPLAWRAAVLPLDAPGAALAVTSCYVPAAGDAITAALPAVR